MVWLIQMPVLAQKNLTLEACYAQVQQAYPLLKQRAVLDMALQKQLQNLQSNFKPQVELIGQATYQSDVTSFPIKLPNIDVPSIAKDQYKVYAEIKQNVFDGGMIKAQKAIQEASNAVENQKVIIDLDRLKERVNQLFFTILLAQSQRTLTATVKDELESKIKKVEAGIQNGVGIQSQLRTLQVEILKLEQKLIEIDTQEKTARESLGLLLNQDIADVSLVRPAAVTLATSNALNRPELRLFALQKEMFTQQAQQITAKNLPKVGLFLQTGFGRPALNMLSNDFKGYYLGGLRLNWSLGGLYTQKNERALLNFSQQSIDIQQETFLLNTNIARKQAIAEVEKLEAILQKDGQIIALRTKIKEVSSVQLDNGTLSATDFVADVSAENQAKENKLLHEIQRLMAQASYQTIVGGN